MFRKGRREGGKEGGEKEGGKEGRERGRGEQKGSTHMWEPKNAPQTQTGRLHTRHMACCCPSDNPWHTVWHKINRVSCRGGSVSANSCPPPLEFRHNTVYSCRLLWIYNSLALIVADKLQFAALQCHHGLQYKHSKYNNHVAVS